MGLLELDQRHSRFFGQAVKFSDLLFGLFIGDQRRRFLRLVDIVF